MLVPIRPEHNDALSTLNEGRNTPVVLSTIAFKVDHPLPRKISPVSSSGWIF